MSELLVISPVQKNDSARPTRRGIPRVALARPVLVAEMEPITKPVAPVAERQTRPSPSVGAVLITLDGDSKGKRVVVIKDAGAGIVDAYQEILIATSAHVNLDSAGPVNAVQSVSAAPKKAPKLTDYLNASFSLKPGDRRHFMQF
jgi:hypothetical protein